MIGKTVNKTNKTPRKFQLRTALVIPFVLQTVVAVGLVGYLSFRNGQKAVNNVAEQLRQEVAARVQVHLSSYLAKPHLIQQIQINTIRQKLIDSTNFEQMEYYFWLQSQSLDPNIGTIAFANTQGEFVGANKPEKYIVVANAVTNRAIRRYTVDDQENRLEMIREKPNYDARTRDWYKAAVNFGRPTWSEIAPSALGKRLDLSAVSPFYDNTGTLQGVFLMDISLTQISDFLHSFTIGKSGKTLIVERNGLLVASSITNEPFTLSTANGEIKRLHAEKINDKLTQETTNFLLKVFGDLSQIKTPQQLEFFLDGQKQFVQVSPFHDELGILDWLVIIVVPESDFTAEIDANTRTSILLCIGTLLGAIALGIYTSHWVTRPIMGVSQASNELAEGNLDQQVEASPIIEINKLADSFNDMAGQLKYSFASLETKNEELRIAEESYRSIFENALEGIFQSSLQGRFINVNSALANIYGYESPTEMIESITNISEQIYVDPETRIKFQEILDKQGTAKNFEYQSYCKDRSIIWTQIDARVVKDINNNVLYYEGLVQDISDRKRRENELRRQLEELKIEIDHTKREKEVAMLTESSFFQEVQQEMAEVNLDEFWS